jgi:EAL domain-containing protein (putative c-di-GMP-specific phosphodiesterase class I)
VTNELDVASQIRERLIKDLKENNFVLFSQSIVPVDPAMREAPYREILVRFKEEEQDLVAPGTFLPVLEEHGLTSLLDRWVVAQVLKWIRDSQAVRGPRCSINLSRDTIRRDHSFGEFVVQGLHRTGVAPSALTFEIPLMEALAGAQSLARLIPPLRGAGCTFAISGFTGEEAVFELAATMGIAFAKIDGSLIYRIARDPLAKASVQAIHQRCHRLGMRTIGMQVESKETLDVLRSLHVDYAQGFGIDHPKALK